MLRKPTTVHLGVTIRRRRVEAGMTQAELAHKIGSADATLSRIERGKMSPSQAMIEAIATGLACSVRDLFEPGPPTPPRKIRPAHAKLVQVTDGMTDAEIDDIVRALRTLVKVGKRLAHRTP